MKAAWYMGGCQNYDPLLCPLNTRCRSIIRSQEGTIVLITTHIQGLARYIIITWGLDEGPGLCGDFNADRSSLSIWVEGIWPPVGLSPLSPS